MSRKGLNPCLWGMTAAMNIPNAVYLYIAFVRPVDVSVISGCVVLEQLGYGFGFTALTFFMMQFSNGKHQTAHYAICTGLMALGMMLPGMISGWIQELTGYRNFFIWIMICTLPSFWATIQNKKIISSVYPIIIPTTVAESKEASVPANNARIPKAASKGLF